MSNVPARIGHFIDVRLGVAKFTRTVLNKAFPDHWSFMLGEIALYSFIVLVATGIYMTLFFDPSMATTTYHGSYAPMDGTTMSRAYASAVHMSFDVKAGLVIRQTHHWAALLFIGAIVVHMCRIFFTGAYRRPREINWMIGLSMLILAIVNGFTGYSMADDLVSGTGLRIAYSIIQSIPIIGTWLAFDLFKGEFPGDVIISRLFVSHVLLVPAAIVGLLTAHLGILWHQKHTQFPGPGRRERNVVGSRMWPAYAAKSMGLLALVAGMCVLFGGLVQINPFWQFGPYEPAHANTPAQPDWYMGWIEGAIRLAPPFEIRAFGHAVPALFFPAVLLPGIVFGVLFLWPFIEPNLTRDYAEHQLLDRPSQHPWRTSFGCAALTFFGLLLLAGGDDVEAVAFRVDVTHLVRLYQALLFILPPLMFVFSFVLCRQRARNEREHWDQIDHEATHFAPADPPNDAPATKPSFLHRLLRKAL